MADGFDILWGALKVTEAAEMRRDKDAMGRYPTDHFLVEAAGE